MIEVQLPQMVLSFDGRVVEIFQSGSSQGSRRFHITQLVTAEITKGRKSRLKLMFPSAGVIETIPVESVAEVEQFVAALLGAQGAM